MLCPHPPPKIPLVVVLTYGNESKCNRHNYQHCVQAAISVSSKQTCNQKTPIDKGKDRAAAPGMSWGWEEVSHPGSAADPLSRVRVAF